MATAMEVEVRISDMEIFNDLLDLLHFAYVHVNEETKQEIDRKLAELRTKQADARKA